MWIKKSAVIAAENGVTVPYMKTKAPDGNNYVNSTLNAYYKNNTVVQGKPANTSDYIYIPALGDYELGYFNLAGQVGFYWSSTSSPFMRPGNAYPLAYYLYISKDEITLYDYFCYDGFQLWELQ
jgi:lipoprotein